MNKYELAVQETRSVLGEWTDEPFKDNGMIAQQIVERLIAKGVIQSTNEDDLRDFRTGPLEPGRVITGGVSE